MPNMTDKQRAFCRSYVANGGNGSQAAKTAGYADHRAKGSKLLKLRSVREEIERLQVAIAKRGNQIMAEALVGADQPPPVDTGLAAIWRPVEAPTMKPGLWFRWPTCWPG